jgi:hypothetical protein
MRYSSTYIIFEDTHTTSATTIVPVHKNSWSVSSDLRDSLGFNNEEENELYGWGNEKDRTRNVNGRIGNDDRT